MAGSTEPQQLWHYGGAELLPRHYGWGAELPLKHYGFYNETVYFVVGFLRVSQVDTEDLFEDGVSFLVPQLVL